LDRCALFVDANYALGEGALVVHGTRNRDSVSWDYAGLLKLLASVSRDRTGLPLLRCYWYDTASDGGRAAEHEALADVPGIKLRLSKARPTRKEGVEAEIRKDLTALARNRAVSDVIIVSAEEDLAPVIAEIQDLGIRTVLFHIANNAGWAISRTLRQECDDVIEVGAAHLQPYVDLISGAEPQLPAASFRELAGAATQASGPHPAIEAPPMRLYGSTLASDYEHAAVVGAGQVQGHRQDPPRFAENGETTRGVAGGDDSPRLAPAAQHMQGSGSSQGQPTGHAPAVQPSMTQAAGGQGSPGQLAREQSAQPPLGQAAAGQAPGYPMHAQQQSGLQPPGQPEHGQQPLGAPATARQNLLPEPHRGQPQVGADIGFDAGRFGGQQNHGPVGQPHDQQSGFDQRGGPDDSRGQPDSLGLSSRQAMNGASQSGPGQNGVGRLPLGQQQPGQAQFGQAQFGQAQFGQAQFGQGTLAHDRFGQAPPSHVAGAPGPPGNGVGNEGPGGYGGSGADGQRANGSHLAGQRGNGPHVGGFPSHGVPPTGAPPTAMAAGGMPANGMSSEPSVMPGQASRGAGTQPGGLGATHHQDAAFGQAGSGQPGLGHTGAGPGSRHGSHAAPAMPSAAVRPDMMALDNQRAPSQQRQLPPDNGMPYAQDRSMPHGPGQSTHFSGQVATSAYGQDSYASQHSAVAPVAISVGDAVQSAHAEGFGFGEAVARDAPALWLEAVLARKPRMPSDLEARLLQGSALPIDSLLHDEVRHALRRGFWDALERSRR